VHPGEDQRIEFRLLGSVEAVAGDRVVEISSPKQRALLASLLVRCNRVVPVDVLVEDLWGEAPPISVQSTLHSLVSRLRRALTTAGCGEPPRLRGRDGGYILESPPDRVDAFRFDRLVEVGRRALADGDAARAADTLRGALALWRGGALGDLADRPFARAEAQRLEEARRGAVEDLAEALLALGRAAEVLGLLEPHVAGHPLRERPWGQTMLALYRLGRQADALRVFQRVRRVLREELGVEPMPELRSLAERILRQAADLGGPGGTAAAHTRIGDIVVFVCTDLARPEAPLLEAVEAHGGEVFDSADGLRIAFPTVPAALGAAVAVQRGLPAPPAVRIAVHAGAAQRRAGTWVGPALSRAARLLATAAAGQIVCSHVAAELGVDDLPADVRLVDLGEHRLADLARPQRVYQVAHPDLPREFPPLQSLDACRHNLPVALTSFVGRERELGEVVDLLGSARLLTLAGTGGAGKTRLALQAAAAVLARFPDGAWLVELAPVRDPAHVADEVATALGLLPGAPGGPTASVEGRLCAHLRAHRLLLVLDNCEHLVDGAARLAHTMLTRCPNLTVLATSREVLGVPGEVVWTVPPLSMPPADAARIEDLAGSDAVALFCERARAAQPGFGLSEANAAAVARICQRLDGIPLGLELAAGKIRVLGVDQVAERLDDRFRLLTAGARTGVPRHQTLRAALDWSYRLLPAAEQVALRRLSVFRGTFTLDAVEAVIGADVAAGEALGLLTRLVDKSMVAVFTEEPQIRYGLLETVREYATGRMTEAGEADEVRTRHRDIYLGLADDWASATHYWNWWQWLRRISADRDDFAAALEWSLTRGDREALLRLAAAHWPYWYWGEAPGWRRWLGAAVERCTTASAARVEALLALASLLTRSGADLPRSEALFAQARQVAVGLPDPQSLAQVDFYRAHVLLGDGEPRAAEPLLHAALERSSNDDFLGWCHWALGWVAILDDDLDEAGIEFEASLRIAEGVDDESMRAHVCSALALVAALRGDGAAAAAMAARAVCSAERIVGAPRVLMMALARAGQAAVLSGDDAAEVAVSRLLQILHNKGATYWADEALAVAGLVLADQRPPEAALALCASRSLDGRGGIAAFQERLQLCRTRLVERLGPDGWRAAEQCAKALSVGEAIGRALAAVEAR
jgi:predicted ATPase/DNA-binding SARP family transcriptional activator